MKAKRRHELQTNILADWLGKQVQLVIPHWKTIAAVAGLAVLGGVMYVAMFNRPSAGQLASGDWSLFFDASYERNEELRSKALVKVADEQRVTAAGLWARQLAADEQLTRGVELLYSDQTQAEKVLRQAEGNLQDILKHNPQQRMLRRRALFALAQTYESLGELEKSVGQYEQLVADAAIGGSSALTMQAERRLTLLVDPTTGQLRPEMVAFHKAFSQYNPPLEEPTTNASGFQHPPINFDPLPDRPELFFPGSEDYDPPKADPPKADPPKADPPKADPADSSPPKGDSPSQPRQTPPESQDEAPSNDVP